MCFLLLFIVFMFVLTGYIQYGVQNDILSVMFTERVAFYMSNKSDEK